MSLSKIMHHSQDKNRFKKKETPCVNELEEKRKFFFLDEYYPPGDFNWMATPCADSVSTDVHSYHVTPSSQPN